MHCKQTEREPGYKGNEFRGIAGGRNYVRWAALFGMNKRFYHRAMGLKYLPPNAQILDLGCGSGSLTKSFAAIARDGDQIIGVDISDDQLDYARIHCQGMPVSPLFMHMSMDELSFGDQHFDIVCSSMALHETPPEVRRGTIKEVSRVLKPGGLFIYTDRSKPRLGFWGIIWFPLIRFGQKNHDNWYNTYLSLCEEVGLVRIEDEYISSIARRQVFVKVKS